MLFLYFRSSSGDISERETIHVFFTLEQPLKWTRYSHSFEPSCLHRAIILDITLSLGFFRCKYNQCISNRERERERANLPARPLLLVPGNNPGTNKTLDKPGIASRPSCCAESPECPRRKISRGSARSTCFGSCCNIRSPACDLCTDDKTGW